MSTLQL